MADQQDITNSNLVLELERKLHRINFYRFCQFVEQLSPSNVGLGCSESPSQDPIRFAPAPDMAFPASELKYIERNTIIPRPDTVRTTFLGLYGVDAVMPYALLDDIIKRQEGYDALTDFLDIFNHRIITQFYRIWLKYHYPASFHAGGQDPISRCLLSLTGLGITGTEKVVATPSSRFLALMGLVTQRTRTAEGIIGMIKVVVANVEVEVEEFYPTWVNVDKPTQLGGQDSLQLGKNAMLGRRFKESNQTIKITIIPQQADIIDSLLPDEQQHTDVMMLLRLYLGYRVDAQLYLKIDKNFLPRTQLKATGFKARLGQTARLPDKTVSTNKQYILTNLGCYRGIAA